MLHDAPAGVWDDSSGIETDIVNNSVFVDSTELAENHSLQETVNIFRLVDNILPNC